MHKFIRWMLYVMVLMLIAAPYANIAQAREMEQQAEPPLSLPAITVSDSPRATAAPLIVEAPSPEIKIQLSGLEYGLAQLYAAHQSRDESALAAFAGQRYINLKKDTVTVILEMARDPEAHSASESFVETVLLPSGQVAKIGHGPPVEIRRDMAEAIAAAGAVYQTAYRNWVQVESPIASLETLAQLADVSYVRLPFPSEQHDLPSMAARDTLGPEAGSEISEGVELTGGDVWHDKGYDGKGINLAVFDFGFTGWDTRQSEGNLPGGGDLVLHDFSAAYDFGPPGTTGQEHGTACAEVAYDMAPGSTVHLYAWSTEVEFGNAVSDYIDNVSDNKVASMSVGWVNAGPYDGTGPINDIINSAQVGGIFWSHSAGNYQKRHWSDTSVRYSNTDYITFGSGNIQGYGPTPGTAQFIPAGTTVSAYLEWNDWNATRDGNQNNIDYDLELYRWTGSSWVYVTTSNNDQCSDSSVSPTEAIAYTSIGGYYGLAIRRFQVPSVCRNRFSHWMELYTFNSFYQSGTGNVASFWYANQCNSLTIPADGDGAVTVGATFWGDDANSGQEYGLETFSSFGPRNAAGGANPGTTVNKPDITAPDGVTTATYGDSDGLRYASGGAGFWGTSPAAAHVAGMAATLWSKESGYSLADLRSRIQSEAVYKGGGGTCGGSLYTALRPESATQNNRFGWGRGELGPPTMVDLARFEAIADGDAIRVEWETATELDNLGFNLYRSQTPDSGYVQLNESLIAAQNPGGVMGAIYAWLDSSAAPGVTYYYRLEDIDIHGHRTLHGPVTATVAATPPPVFQLYLPLLFRPPGG